MDDAKKAADAAFCVAAHAMRCLNKVTSLDAATMSVNLCKINNLRALALPWVIQKSATRGPHAISLTTLSGVRPSHPSGLYFYPVCP